MTEQNDIAIAADFLRQGELVVHATEGVWGISCDPNNQSAVQRVINLKGRDAAKGLLLIGASADMFERELADHTPELAAAVKASWPGPHTWVLPNHIYTNLVTGGRDTIACRVPGHAQARDLSAAFGGPLVSTSANFSGQPAITSQDDARATFADQVSMVLSGAVLRPGQASTIYGLGGEVLRG